MRIWDFLFARKEACFVASEFLYHYTSLATLGEFVSDEGDFYCTHFRMLNDGSEMSLGIDFVCEHLQRQLNWTNKTTLFFREQYLKSIASEDIVIPWVMSFSRDQDSLHQWMAYTDSCRGGVSVGVRRAQLWDALDRFPGCYSKAAIAPDDTKGRNKSFELRLLPCLYSVRDKLLIKDLVVEMLSPHLPVFARIGDENARINSQDWCLAVNAVLELSTIIKHDAFAAEQEERLILLPMTLSDADCKMIGGKKRWRTYLSEVQKEGIMSPNYRGLRGMIREIVISPHGNNDDLSRVQKLLNEYDMTYCELKNSCLPYRGNSAIGLESGGLR